MGTPDDAKARAAATYDAAADSYDDPANSFWNRFGRRTVERLRLPPGARVLDACCGAGASAIPAAEAVGSRGAVLGIDLAQNLLALACSASSSFPTCRRRSARCGAPSAPVEGSPSRRGDRDSSSPVRPRSGMRFATCGPTSTRASTRGIASPIHRPSERCCTRAGPRVRRSEANLRYIRESAIRAVEANVVYAIATKPAPASRRPDAVH